MTPPEDKPLAHLSLWEDPVERDGPEQMACDEALFALAEGPVMRVFRWRRPWVSVGYFATIEADDVRAHGLPVCRRWTGGGTVVHADDFTFSLCVPRGQSLSAARPRESYRLVHLALADALEGAGVQAGLASPGSRPSPHCFAAPVEHDLVLGGEKIAGGAQRRTSRGLLHQGSVQTASFTLHGDFGLTFARALSACVGTWVPPDGFEARVAELAEGKYASPGFLRGPFGPKNFTQPAAA